MSVLENWDNWKNFLGDRLNYAQEKGMSDETITDLATEIGGYLANEVDSKTIRKKCLLIFGALLLKMNSAPSQI